MMKRFLFIFLVFLSVFLIQPQSFAQAPQLINYQGKLTNKDGTLPTDTYTIAFSIYSDSSGTNRLWGEVHSFVDIRNGIFNVVLGSVALFPTNLFTSPGERYLGIKVGSEPEMRPLFQFTSVAYSIHANSAKSLSANDGDPVDAVVVDAEGNVGIGTSNPLKPLHINTRSASDPIIIENCMAYSITASQLLDQLPNWTLIIGGVADQGIYFYWKDQDGIKRVLRLTGDVLP